MNYDTIQSLPIVCSMIPLIRLGYWLYSLVRKPAMDSVLLTVGFFPKNIMQAPDAITLVSNYLPGDYIWKHTIHSVHCHCLASDLLQGVPVCFQTTIDSKDLMSVCTYIKCSSECLVYFGIIDGDPDVLEWIASMWFETMFQFYVSSSGKLGPKRLTLDEMLHDYPNTSSPGLVAVFDKLREYTTLYHIHSNNGMMETCYLLLEIIIDYLNELVCGLLRKI